MISVNVHEAKTHLSRLLARVESGEEIIIAKAGRPIARIIPEICITVDNKIELYDVNILS